MAFTPHKYDSPELPGLLKKALAIEMERNNVLHAIQEATGIPGLHTDINSNDDTPGVAERLESMFEAEESERDVKLFASFDED
jgi:hypothetical protein